MPRLSRRRFLCLMSSLLLPAACAKNPVTGRTHLQLDRRGEVVAEAIATADSMERKGNFIHDGKLEYRVIEIGKRLLAQMSDPERDYRFFISKDAAPDAFCLADGTVVMTIGLYRLLDEDEVAVIVGHEIGHVYSRHGQERRSRELMAKAILKANRSVAIQNAEWSVYQNPYNPYNWRRLQDAQRDNPVLSYMLEAGFIKRYSRINEFEADSIGMLLAVKAGYNPQSAVRLWQRFAKDITKTRDTGTDVLATHPCNRERLEALQAMVPIAERFGPGGDLADQPITRYAELLKPVRDQVQSAQAASGEPDSQLGQKDYK